MKREEDEFFRPLFLSGKERNKALPGNELRELKNVRRNPGGHSEHQLCYLWFGKPGIHRKVLHYFHHSEEG